MSLIIARIYKTCQRCHKTVGASDEIMDDGHDRGVCRLCLSELKLKREMRRLAYLNPKCHDCGKAKPRECFNEHQLVKWDSLRSDRMVFGERVVYTPKVTCSTCETLQSQKRVAKNAIGDLRRKSVRWWKRGTKLTEKNLTEEMIETKTAEMKVRNLWQTPKI